MPQVHSSLKKKKNPLNTLLRFHFSSFSMFTHQCLVSVKLPRLVIFFLLSCRFFTILISRCFKNRPSLNFCNDSAFCTTGHDVAFSPHCYLLTIFNSFCYFYNVIKTKVRKQQRATEVLMAGRVTDTQLIPHFRSSRVLP